MVSIAASIRDGRPHGMPAFKNRMTIEEVWQLSGYVKAISAYSASVNAPARNDAEPSGSARVGRHASRVRFRTARNASALELFLRYLLRRVKMDHSLRDTAFEKQVVDLLPALHKFARRFHNSPCDVDDLVQETVSKVLANADKFQQGTRLRSWMFTIMRNSFCTRFAVRKREHVGLGEDAAAGPSVGAQQEWAIRGHELGKAILGLSPRYRQALTLIFIDGMSYEAASEQCGCAVGTVKSRVNRARQILARQLDDD